MNALEVKGITKKFENVLAVNNASFTVPEGSIFGLIGRNGAGKTTSIRMIMNIYMPDSGEVFFRGKKVGQEFRDRVGYLPEERGLYKKMKVLDTLLFFAELKGATGREVKVRALNYLKKFDLLDRKDSKIEDLSKGNQQKIQFIATILHEPEFLILDEPFSGLDPINTNLLKEIILDLKQKGKVIIFSTHLMDFAEKMCDDIALIHNGEIILNGNLSNIKAEYGLGNVSLTYDGDISFLNHSNIVENINNFGHQADIKVKDPSQTQELLQLLLNNNVTIKKFVANEISLHEIFVKLTGTKEEINAMEVNNA